MEPDTEVVQPRSRRRGIIIVIVAILAVAALAFWWHSTFYEDTDDAQVSGHLIQVSSRIQGHVLKVYVDENQQVKKGDLIAELDPRDYQVAVEQAQAALASAQANAAFASVAVPLITINTGSNLTSANADLSGSHAAVQEAEGQLRAAQARVVQAQANNAKAQSDLQRYKPLVDKDVISKQQWDAAVAAAAAAAGRRGRRPGQRPGRRRTPSAWPASARPPPTPHSTTPKPAPSRSRARTPRPSRPRRRCKQAQAQLDQAQLNLSYCQNRRPGRRHHHPQKRRSRPERLRPARTCSPWSASTTSGSPPTSRRPSFEHMRAGQPVEVHVDATGKDYSAKVTQIGGATGSVLSLFPPENATGNYVKVVQRVPVRIDFTDLAKEDPNHRLRPGLSVEPKVRVKD